MTQNGRVRFPILILAAALCGSAGPLVAQFYRKSYLVSDVSGMAKTTDPNLVVGWGITYLPGSPWWVNATQTGDSLIIDGSGTVAPLVVSIPGPTTPSLPTGIAANSGSSFEVASGKPALFLFVTLDGTIAGWNPGVSLTSAVTVVDHSGAAKYSGLALAQRNGADTLYAANFGQNRVDVFDGQFNAVTLPSGAFTDLKVPDNFSVFNVQNEGGMLYVTYAPKDSLAMSTGPGPGMGYVDVYDVNGALVRRLRHGRWMDAPWGIAIAPADFGHLSHAVLVGMFGSGRIAAFDAKTGNFRGLMRSRHGKPLTIFRGLWGLGFGNGEKSGPANTLYFASGLLDAQGNHHGVFGKITVMPAAENGAMKGH